MKIILSRKGFDLQNGGQPSPIMPNGALLSLPIPGKLDEKITYSHLKYDGRTYSQIIQELKPKNSIINKNTPCHLDPDIRQDIYAERVPNWKAIFGQHKAAQGHLVNIKKDDIFLFFGWFKQTENENGKLKYKTGSPDLHIIYGYLQVGEIFKSEQSFPLYASLHPHVGDGFKNSKNNCIYVANEKLTFNENFSGAGTFSYNKKLVLTKDELTKSRWELPDFFKQLRITYHNEHSFKDDYFQSAAIGQEFIIDADENLIRWVKNLIEIK